MVLKISYLVLIGIITVTNGKPAYEEDSYFVKNEHDLQKILQALANQGKYDIALSHHEDGPKTHHEDRARISHHDEKPSKNYNRNDKSNSARYASREYNYSPSQNSLQALNLLLKKNADVTTKYSDNDHDIFQTLIGLDNNKYKKDKRRIDEESEYDNSEDILAFLNDLQRNVADDGNYVSELRCAGNRCGRNRNDRNDDDRYYDKADDDRYDKDNLRCKGNRCGRDRDERTDDRYTDRDDLRCRGKNCARSRDGKGLSYADDRNDRNKNDDYYKDDKDIKRCRGNNCARSRYDDSDLKYDSKLLPKKFKINDDLDAMVLGMTDVDRLLTKLSAPKQQRSTKNKFKVAKVLDTVDLGNLLETRNSYDKKSNVEAVVFDLTQIEDGDVVAKQLKQLLSQNNEASDGDYEDYGNLIEEHLKQGAFSLDKKAKTGKANSKILPHNQDNNNVYVPQWLLDEVISKTKFKEQGKTQLMKSMFPLTRLQKEKIIKTFVNRKEDKPALPRKIFRRNFEQDVGVPFHLEVQGLGQVSP